MGAKAMGGTAMPFCRRPNCVRGLSLKLVRSPCDFGWLKNADLWGPHSRIELEN
jgi:hypothetical protein